MIYRKLGHTGIEVSALGFGCMRLPLAGKGGSAIDERKATEMVHYAIERGINYFDTAYPYHSSSLSEAGASEPFLARALQGGFRERVYVATKLPAWLIHSGSDMDRFLEEQLRRLQSETIDFYLLHSLNQKTWDALSRFGVLEFLDRSVRSGKIKYAGFSFHDEPELFTTIVDAYRWDFCQIMYNYFDEHFQAGRQGLNYAASKGIGVVVMEPMRGGALVHGLPNRAREILKKARPERSEVEWALRWVWSHPEVATLLSGMSTMDQLIENIHLAEEISGCTWSDDESDAIARVNGIINELQRISCTSCGYCMPCPEGVDIPRNFMLSNDYHMLNDQGARVRYYRLLSEAERASGCIRCGECLDKCPQHIPIPDELEHLAGLFEA